MGRLPKGVVLSLLRKLMSACLLLPHKKCRSVSPPLRGGKGGSKVLDFPRRRVCHAAGPRRRGVFFAPSLLRRTSGWCEEDGSPHPPRPATCNDPKRPWN